VVGLQSLLPPCDVITRPRVMFGCVVINAIRSKARSTVKVIRNVLELLSSSRSSRIECSMPSSMRRLDPSAPCPRRIYATSYPDSTSAHHNLTHRKSTLVAICRLKSRDLSYFLCVSVLCSPFRCLISEGGAEENNATANEPENDVGARIIKEDASRKCWPARLGLGGRGEMRLRQRASWCVRCNAESSRGGESVDSSSRALQDTGRMPIFSRVEVCNRGARQTLVRPSCRGFHSMLLQPQVEGCKKEVSNLRGS
jgi:hypothetical protein